MSQPDEILVPQEICDYLRITRAKFYYLASRGRLSFLFKVGNEWRARRSDLDTWIRGNTAIVVSLSKRSSRMTEQEASRSISSDQVQELLGREGYEVTTDGDVLKVKDLESGIVVLANLEDNILFFTVSCMVIAPDAITPDLMHRMLEADNGISTSGFQLYRRPDGHVAITLNNFCKLQEMGADDHDDILSCLEFLVIDVCAAADLLQPALA